MVVFGFSESFGTSPAKELESGGKGRLWSGFLIQGWVSRDTATGTVSEGEGLPGIRDDLTGQDNLLVKRALEWAERTGTELGKVLPPPCFEACD